MKKISLLFTLSFGVMIVSCSQEPAEKEVIVVPGQPEKSNTIIIEKQPVEKSTTIVLDKKGVKVEAKEVD